MGVKIPQDLAGKRARKDKRKNQSCGIQTEIRWVRGREAKLAL